MPYRAINVSQDPLAYFTRQGEEESRLRIADVILRVNHSKREMFAPLIRMATKSKWTHSAIVYLVNEPSKGLENTFLIEARPKGVIMTTWRNEVMPYRKFTVGIKRPKLDWYKGNLSQPPDLHTEGQEDTTSIDYLRYVRNIAMDQMHGLYDHKVVWELASLYIERLARHRLHSIPQIAEAADQLADFFKKWDANNQPGTHVMHFICSGLIQYSFFAALRFRILQDMQRAETRANALHNLRHMRHILYREDPDQVLSAYIQRVLAAQLDLADPLPEDVQDLLKTALPTDFHHSSDLEWRYIVLNGNVWQIEPAPAGYLPQSTEEQTVLEMLKPEPNPFNERHDASPQEPEEKMEAIEVKSVTN